MNKVKQKFEKHFERKDILVDALIYLMILINLISSFSLLAVSLSLPEDALFVQYSVILSGLFFFIVRRFSQPLYSLLISYALICFLPFLLLPFFTFNAIILSVIMNIIIAFFSAKRRFNEKKRIVVSFEHLGATIAVHTIGLALSMPFNYLDNVVDMQNVEVMRFQIFVHALICVCLFIAAHQYFTFENSYGHLAKSPTQPSDVIRKKHFRTIMFFVIFSIIGTPIILVFPYDLAWNTTLVIIRHIISIISMIAEQFSKIGLLPSTGDESFTPSTDIITTNGETPLWQTIIQIAFFIMIIIVTTLIVIGLIRELIRQILRLYDKANPDKSIKKSDMIVDEVKSIKKKKAYMHKKRDFGRGHEKEIRKLFYHHVSTAKRKNVPIKDSDTASEIGDKIYTHQNKDITTLVAQYQKVRYRNILFNRKKPKI